MSAPPAYPAQAPVAVPQPNPAVAPQQTVVLGSIPPQQPATYPKAFKVTGILHLVLGVLSIIFGIVAIIIMAWASYYATPIWTALMFFITTGILGVVASTKKNKCMNVAYMTMCVVSSLVALALLIMYIILATKENSHVYVGHWYTHICHPGRYDNIAYNCAHKIGGRWAVDGLIAFTAFLEGCVCIVGAAYSCVATCSCCRECCTCCTPAPPPTTAYFTNTTPAYRLTQAGGPVYVPVPQVGNPNVGMQTAVVVPQGGVGALTTQPVAMYVVQPANPGFQQQVPVQYVTQPQPGQPPNPAYQQPPPGNPPYQATGTADLPAVKS